MTHEWHGSFQRQMVKVYVHTANTCQGKQLHVTGGKERYVSAKCPVEPRSCCWCEGEEEGKMVAGKNELCPIEWFHFECVFLTWKPRGR